MFSYYHQALSPSWQKVQVFALFTPKSVCEENLVYSTAHKLLIVNTDKTLVEYKIKLIVERVIIIGRSSVALCTMQSVHNVSCWSVCLCLTLWRKLGLRGLCCTGEEQVEYEILEEHFATYDGQFEYGSQLPAVLLR